MVLSVPLDLGGSGRIVLPGLTLQLLHQSLDILAYSMNYDVRVAAGIHRGGRH